MQVPFAKVVDNLRSSYWFVPAVMSVVALILSFVVVEVDRSAQDFIEASGILSTNTPEGARSVLSTITSSTITVIGVVFSLTMVVLSLSSQQYGPLIIRSFLRDRATQFTMGTFSATYVYALMVLRTIRGTEDATFVPHISTLVGVFLALLSLAVLIFFIHHISESIQATDVTSRVSRDIEHSIKELFPEQIGQSAEDVNIEDPTAYIPQDFDEQARNVPATRSGYLQIINEDALFRLAADHDVVIKIIPRPGDFIIKDTTLARIWVDTQEDYDDGFIDRVREAFTLGQGRTQTQDIRFLFNQIVEIATIALSPGVNDPFTAVMCIDRLGEALAQIGDRPMPQVYRYKDGKLCVIANPIHFEEMVHLSYDEIVHYGGEDPKVIAHLMQTLRMLIECIDNEDHRQVVKQYAERVKDETGSRLTLSRERSEINDAYDSVEEEEALKQRS